MRYGGGVKGGQAPWMTYLKLASTLHDASDLAPPNRPRLALELCLWPQGSRKTLYCTSDARQRGAANRRSLTHGCGVLSESEFHAAEQHSDAPDARHLKQWRRSRTPSATIES